MAELRKYGAAATILFPLVKRAAVDFETGATFASGDAKISKDEGTPVNTSNLPVHVGNGIYSLSLTATEMAAASIVVTVIDQSASKVWEDQAVLIETYGHASAQHEPLLEAIADRVLDRPISNVEPAAAFRTLYGALASLVNRVKINASGNLEIYRTNDTDVLETLTATTDGSQQPITELDPP